MALKSSREGLRKELVDYLGNIIIDENLRQSIINSVNNIFVNETDVLTLEEIQASTDLTGKVASASSVKTLNVLMPRAFGNIVGTEADNFENGTVYYAWLNSSSLPFNTLWATIFTQRKSNVGNQQLFCTKGIAVRHFENNTWSGWTKVNLS